MEDNIMTTLLGRILLWGEPVQTPPCNLRPTDNISLTACGHRQLHLSYLPHTLQVPSRSQPSTWTIYAHDETLPPRFPLLPMPKLHAAHPQNHLTLFAANIFRSESYEKTDVCLLSICHSASSTRERPLGLPTIQYYGSSVVASPCAAGAFSFLHHNWSLSNGCNDLSFSERPSMRSAVRTHQYLAAALTLSFERLKRNC